MSDIANNQQIMERQVKGLSTLLQLEKEVRSAENINEYGFIVTNETFRLIPYRQAVFFRSYPSEDVVIEAVSSVATIDKNAPLLVWLKKLIRHIESTYNAQDPYIVEKKDIPQDLQAEWDEWQAAYSVFVPFLDQKGGRLGGVWLNRDTPWQQGEIGLLKWLSEAYAYVLYTVLQKEQRLKIPLYRQPIRKKTTWAIIGGIALLMLFPVNQTALAPAEVVPKAPILVTAPFNGVVEAFHVKPNESVTEGQLLFHLDETNINNQFEVAKKALDVAQAEYRKVIQKGFTDLESRAEIAILKAQMELKETELNYAQELKDRIQVKAERSGIAIYDDPNQWIGKPVQVGEKIITIADPNAVELEIMLPVNDAINLKDNARVRVFFNVDPLNPYNAKLHYASYEAQITPDQALAYRLKAGFIDDTLALRVGLKGTAKIYGKKVILFYYLMRRPLSALRRFFGI